MRARGSTARRLAAASLLALALLAAGVGGGQPVAPSSAFGYFPPSGGLASGGEVPARLPGGTAGATAGAAAGGATRVPIGVVGYKPAVVARLDPRTLRPLPGPRIELPYGVSGYGWSPDGSRLVLGDLDDDALHVIDLTVWGGDSSVTGDTPQNQRMDQEPSGLKLVDTRAWTVRPLDPAAPNASWQAGRLLAYGRTWDDEAEHERRTGVTVHGPGWARHLLGIRAVDDAYLNGDLVYASVDNGGDQPGRVVVSLRSGRVVASSDEPLPYLLLGDPGPGC